MSEERVKRNVEDVAYVESDLTERPMREVLRERAGLHNQQDKRTRERAFRQRAGMVGVLQSCLCCWPIVKASTDSEHEEWCPSHALHLSQLEVKRRYPETA